MLAATAALLDQLLRVAAADRMLQPHQIELVSEWASGDLVDQSPRGYLRAIGAHPGGDGAGTGRHVRLEGVAERFNDPAVHKTIEVDLALITYYDELLRDLELSIVKTAKQHEAHTLYLLQTVPGIGKILSLVRLYAIHDIGRFPRVQDFASYARLVKCSKESAGKR